jgi:arylsulfatase
MAFGSYAGIGQGGTGVLKVDGTAVATQKMEHTIPYVLQWDESLDIGSDTGTPVNDADYQIPFTFTGKLNKITLTIDRPKLSAEDVKRLRETARAAGDGPSSEAVEAASETAQLRASGDNGTTLLDKAELRIEKIEGCRKQAEAQHLGRIERIRFVEKCMR